MSAYELGIDHRGHIGEVDTPCRVKGCCSRYMGEEKLRVLVSEDPEKHRWLLLHLCNEKQSRIPKTELGVCTGMNVGIVDHYCSCEGNPHYYLSEDAVYHGTWIGWPASSRERGLQMLRTLRAAKESRGETVE